MSSLGERVLVSCLREGKLVLPSEFLDQLDLNSGDLVVLSSRNDEIVIEKLAQFRVVRGGGDGSGN